MGFLSALLFGSGLSLAIEAGFWRYDNQPFLKWFCGGTAGIGMALMGVVVLIKTGLFREKF